MNLKILLFAFEIRSPLVCFGPSDFWKPLCSIPLRDDCIPVYFYHIFPVGKSTCLEAARLKTGLIYVLSFCTHSCYRFITNPPVGHVTFILALFKSGLCWWSGLEGFATGWCFWTCFLACSLNFSSEFWHLEYFASAALFKFILVHLGTVSKAINRSQQLG